MFVILVLVHCIYEKSEVISKRTFQLWTNNNEQEREMKQMNENNETETIIVSSAPSNVLNSLKGKQEQCIK